MHHATPVLLLAVTVATAVPASARAASDDTPSAPLPSAAPTFVLDAASQVAGDDPVQGASDAAARVWLSWSPEGLKVTARVVDDHLLLAGEGADDRRRVRSDHLELWLSFDDADLPPIAFENQFEVVEVPDEAKCQEMGWGDACRDWLEEQRGRRREFARGFRRQYILDDGGAVVLDRRDGDDATGASSRLIPVEGGWHLEATLPPGLWPPTRQAPVTAVRVLVDLVDNDRGHEGQESFLSSSADREFGEPSTWNAQEISPPLTFPARPGFEMLAHEPGLRWFYRPGAEVDTLLRFENEPDGYQYAPGQPSPRVVTMALPTEPEVAAGGAQAYLLRDPTRGPFLLCRGAEARTTVEPHWYDSRLEVHSVERGGTAHLVVVAEGTYKWLGTGACGACPVLSATAHRLDPDGCTQTAVLGLSSPPEGWFIGRAVAPDGAGFGFRVRRGLDDDDKTHESRYLIWSDGERGFVVSPTPPPGLGEWYGEDD